jgi:hypothetical protein
VLGATIYVNAVGSIPRIACCTAATVLARALMAAECVDMAVMFTGPARLNLNAGWRDSSDVVEDVTIFTVTLVLADSHVNAVAVHATWITIAVGVVATHTARIRGQHVINHPHWTLATLKPIIWRTKVHAFHPHEAWVVHATIGVNTLLLPVTRVSGLTGTAVMTWALMITHRVHMAIVFT